MRKCMERDGVRKNGITEGEIWKQLLLFFFPILLGTFFQQLYNTADAVIVGRFVGKEALAAVGGTTGTLINLLVGFFVGLSSGATVIISQYYGAGKKESVQKSVHTAAALALAGGVVLMVIGIAIAPAALRAMDTPEDIIEFSLTYIRIYFFGMIANLAYNIGAGILRAIGDSKRPLYFLIVSCFVNIILDILFVAVLKLGVAGVGIATVLSQVVSAVLVLAALMRTNDCYQFQPSQIRFDSKILIRIVQIGLPAGFQSVMYSLSNVMIQSNINSFGTDVIAAWTAYGKIDGVFWMIMGAFGVSITTFVGQNYGAGKLDRVRRGIRVCMAMAAGTAIGMSILLYFFGSYVYLLFTDDAAVLAQGMDILHFLVPTFITYVCIEILSGALRGAGDAIVPMLMTCLGVCVLRIIWLFTAVPKWPGIKTVIFSYPLTWIVTSILFVIYYTCFSSLKTRSRRKRRLERMKDHEVC